MEDPILPRQRWAFLLCAVSAPAVTVAARLPWVWVLTVLCLCAALLVGLFFFMRHTGLSAALQEQQVFGLWGAKVLALLRTVFSVLLLWQLALGTDSAFPQEQTLPFVPLTLLAVTAFSASKGRAAVVRAAAVLFFLLTGLYAAVFFFGLQAADFSRLTALPQCFDLLPLGVVLLLPFYGWQLYAPATEREPFPLGFLSLFLLLPTLSSILSNTVAGSGGSFYQMAGSLEVLSFAQRMEPLISVLMVIGWFCALCLILLSCQQDLKTLGLPSVWSGGLCCLLTVPGILLQIRISPVFLLCSGSVFCVFLPLLTQCFVVRKKEKIFLKNKQKKC